MDLSELVNFQGARLQTAYRSANAFTAAQEASNAA